jgi:DNA-binding HxlR family transcriptional regulator
MAKTSQPKAERGRFAYEGLDRVIHEKARLGVLTSLVAHPKGLVFADLKRLCGLTDGNLSRHLQVLQEARLVDILKGYDQNRPQTICRITPNGRRRFLSYLAVLEQVVRDAAEGRRTALPSPRILLLHKPDVIAWLVISLLCPETLQCKVLLIATAVCASPSSWTAMAAGPPPAACRARPDTTPASKPFDESAKPRPVWASQP